MKKGIHPEWNKKAKIIYNGKTVLEVGSTASEINVEIWSGSHPFYTGAELLVDTDNLVDKFNKKLEQKLKVPKSKTLKRLNREKGKTTTGKSGLTLKDMMKQIK